MERVYILMPMGPNTMETGSKTNNTVKELNNGQMELCMKENIMKVKRMVKENSYLPMVQCTKEISK